MNDTIKAIQQLAKDKFESTRACRRHLHQYPELSFEEKETAQFLCNQLDRLNVEYETNVGGYGIVARIKGQSDNGNVIALRADMDALPIAEANNVPYKSKNKGIMHACGHDVHSASLLGSVGILSELRHHFAGEVKVLFQPAEEKLPGGASLMIKDGALKNPEPTSIFGQHVHPPLQVGKVGFCPGAYMASADEIFMTIKGKGGHAALPHEVIDPLVILSNVILALQSVVSRRGNPTIPTVLSFGKVISDGGATNVIPDQIHVQGTFRTMDEEWRYKAHQIIKETTLGIASGLGGDVDLDIKVGYPSLFNDHQLTNSAFQSAKQYLGDENVIELPIRMTAEDFSYYSQQMPACFYRLGTGNPSKGITSPVHTNTFDVDEHCLEVGSGLMSWLAINSLVNN